MDQDEDLMSAAAASVIVKTAQGVVGPLAGTWALTELFLLLNNTNNVFPVGKIRCIETI